MRCEYEFAELTCKNEATGRVYDKKIDRVVNACKFHMEIIVNFFRPEYTHYCEDCGCLIPIN